MIKKKNFYYTFINFLIRQGNKNKIIKLINQGFFQISSIIKLPPYYILSQIFLKLNVYIEVRKVKFRRKYNFIPFPISYQRRIYLISKWLLIAIKQNKKNISLLNKFISEIFLLFNLDSNSLALKLKKENENQAVLNRSNTHFRW